MSDSCLCICVPFVATIQVRFMHHRVHALLMPVSFSAAIAAVSLCLGMHAICPSYVPNNPPLTLFLFAP